MGLDEILHRYVLSHEKERVLEEVSGGIVGGCYGGCAIDIKILRDELWWPTIHVNAIDYVKSCGVC